MTANNIQESPRACHVHSAFMINHLNFYESCERGIAILTFSQMRK